MRINFDFWYILRDDDGFIQEAGVHYYEGDYFTVAKIDPETMKSKDTLEYKRTKKLGMSEIGHVNKFRTDEQGHDACVYTTEDFGRIQSDDELVSFLEGEIKKDTARQVIDEQDRLKKKI